MAAHPPFPVGVGRLVSRYGVRPGRTTGQPTFHAGIDLFAERGTPVLSVADGEVRHVASDATRRGPFDGYGNAVIIRHGDGTWVMFAHLDQAMVGPGQSIQGGDQIGTVGNTSNGKFRGMGVHTHAEWRPERRGRAPYPGPYGRFNSMDPVPWLRAKGITFGRRGEIVVTPGSEAEQTIAIRGAGPSAPRAGLFPAKGKFSFAGLGYVTLGQKDQKATAAYAPGAEELYKPVRWERSGRWGLSTPEWIAVGSGAAVLATGIGYYAWVRYRGRRRAA